MNPEINYDMIEAYINNQLDPAQRESFEKQIAADPKLEQAVDRFRRADTILEAAAREDLRQKMQQWRKESTRPKPKIFTFKRSLAAAVILLAIASTFIIFQINKYSNESLALRYFEAFDEGSPMGAQENDNLNAGIKAFEEKAYTQAINLLSTIPAEHPDYDKAQLYIGSAYIKLKKFDKATPYFRRILAMNYSLLKDLAQWNLLLAWLGAGQTDAEFYDLLDKIRSDSNHRYHSKAQKLLKDLNSFWR